MYFYCPKIRGITISPHPMTAINDEIARGVYARTGLADNVDQVVGLGGRTLIGTQTEK